MGDGTYRTEVVSGVIDKLNEFVNWMEKQNTLSLFDSSLLIVYEGGQTQEKKLTHIDIRLVDFAYAYEKESVGTHDENVLFGVKNFILHLQHMLKGMEQ